MKNIYTIKESLIYSTLYVTRSAILGFVKVRRHQQKTWL